MDLGIDKGNKTVSNAKLNGKSNKGYAGASVLNFLIDVLFPVKALISSLVPLYNIFGPPGMEASRDLNVAQPGIPITTRVATRTF
jgi:hypothetical protein